MSKTPHGAPVLGAQILYAFERELAALAPSYRAIVLSGSLTPGAAWRQQTHDIWARIGPELGLRYDRVEPA